MAAAAAGASDGARAAGSEVCGCVSHCPRVWGPWELSPRVGLLSAGFPLSWRAPRNPDCLAGGPAGGCPRSVMMRPPLARPCGKRSRESPTVRAVFRGGQTKHADGKPVRLKTGQPREVPPRPLPAGPHTPVAAGPVSSLRPSHGPLGSRPRKGGLSHSALGSPGGASPGQPHAELTRTSPHSPASSPARQGLAPCWPPGSPHAGGRGFPGTYAPSLTGQLARARLPGW